MYCLKKACSQSLIHVMNPPFCLAITDASVTNTEQAQIIISGFIG